VARKMSPARIAAETPEAFRGLAARLAEIAGERVLVVVDQELGGIQRLHKLVPPLPSVETARAMSDDQLAAAVEATGRGMREIGVGLALSPVIDVVRGSNPWLSGRNLGSDPAVTARIGRGYIRGLAAAGVIATAKHFPGSGPAETDPHDTPTRITVPLAEYQEMHLAPFRAAVDAGVRAVMTGPAIVDAIDPANPASLSPRVMGLLREDLGFSGVVISDDLDSRAIALGRSIEETAVLALQAGIDLLLVGLAPAARRAAQAVIAAVNDGRLDRSRVADAADRVRRLGQLS